MLKRTIQHAVQLIQSGDWHQVGVASSTEWYLVMTRETSGTIRASLTFIDEGKTEQCIIHSFQPHDAEAFVDAIVPILQILMHAGVTVHILGRVTPRGKWKVIDQPAMGGRRLSEKAKKRLLRF